jgi:RNA polymerase sigma-70 factor (ECF subfamily)
VDDDLKLVKSILDGNVDSFNILVNKYEMIVMKFIYNLVKDKEAAEDIAQEVFITVYNKLYSYNTEYKFSSWIFQIAKNKSIDYIRKYRRVYESNLEEATGISSPQMSPEEVAEYKETKIHIERFINQLDDTDKQIIYLRYSQEMTFIDIGRSLDITESTAKRRFYKTKEKFKSYLTDKEKRCK